jgi:hypothetical protein
MVLPPWPQDPRGGKINILYEKINFLSEANLKLNSQRKANAINNCDFKLHDFI